MSRFPKHVGITIKPNATDFVRFETTRQRPVKPKPETRVTNCHALHVFSTERLILRLATLMQEVAGSIPCMPRIFFRLDFLPYVPCGYVLKTLSFP